MRAQDTLQFGFRSIAGTPSRTGLMLLAMAIGVGSVMVLTALGEGARRYVSSEFSQLGTNLLVVLPGRTETTGGAPPIMGETPRDLTLNDAAALTRNRSVHRVAPIAVGSAPVSFKQLEREVNILGSTFDLLPVRQLELGIGKFLPAGDPSRGAAVAVLGNKLKKELFGNNKALGQWIRISDRRFRVIGVLKARGQSLGTDMSDIAIIPVASAHSLFNTTSLFRILVQARSRESIPQAGRDILKTIKERHDGEDDVTVITQDAMLSTFDDIFLALTMTVAGIAAISLAVAGILIMNVMLVAVSQRTSEIGLLKALGSPGRQILHLFLIEASLLSVSGAVIGIGIAFAGIWGLEQLFPEFPLFIPPWAFVAAVSVAIATGLLFGVLPAKRAAALDPVTALAGR
ncbi:MAG: FtsX-like permease family protein [Gammaproteobacteria bacterium]|nr:FtsX-like permease family protein [Gammaproteobacteria bacterium]